MLILRKGLQLGLRGHQFLLRNFAKDTTTIPPPTRMSKIVWLDMEMTGLDLHRDRVMEVACLITDNELNVLAEQPSIVIHQPDALLNSMVEWCTTTHTKTGLLEECRQSKISESKAEDIVLKFLVDNNVAKSECPLAGNSIYMDRMFIREYFPRLDQYLHYRIIDVSTVKELCKRWDWNTLVGAPKKKILHRGLDDIKESLNELKYYKQFMFQKK